MALALVSFLGFVNLYAQRINLSVAIVCMVNQTVIENQTQKESANANVSRPALLPDKCSSIANVNQTIDERDERGELEWSRKMQGVILGSFFYGYLATQILGGLLASKFGGRRVFGIGMFAVSLAALLIPIAARTNYVIVIVLRIIQGLGEGTAFPACHELWSRWAPPEERGKLLGFSYAGAQVGNIITLPLAALLCDYGFDNGWGSIFYLSGVFGLVWCLLWSFYSADSPSLHPRITNEEFNYLNSALGGTSTSASDRKNVSTPWLSMLTSPPVWGLVVVNFSADYGAYTLLTNIPTYMKDVLKFDIKSNGFLSAIPYIAYWVFINIFGAICDYLIKSQKLNVKNARRLMAIIGTIPAAILLVITGYIDCTRPIWAIVLLTMAQAFNGAQFGGGFFVNHIDIAPDYAGILFGISNTIGAVAGILAPLLIGVIVKQGTEAEWRLIFYICAIIVIAGTVFYLTVAEGDIQEWAKPKIKKDEKIEQFELPLMQEKVCDLSNAQPNFHVPSNTCLQESDNSTLKC